jgi:Rrf2 family protein
MKLSTKLRYGLGFLLDVGLNGGGEGNPVTLKDVARRRKVSDKYLWQVIAPLKSAGIVSATPGVNGGYLLARPMGQISLRDLVETLEGLPFQSGPVERKKDRGEVDDATWRLVSDRFSKILETISLESLVNQERMRQAAQAADYCI